MSKNNFLLSRISVRVFMLAALCFFIISDSFAQFKYRDLARRKVVIKTDEDIVEAEVYEGISDKEAKLDRQYYWHDHNMIMSTKGGYTGELLHGKFECQYRHYQLKEKGIFKFGLKEKNWLKWYPSGQIKEIKRFHNGFANGKYFLYDSAGTLIEKGTYNNGMREGKILYRDSSGAYITEKYKNDLPVTPKVKTPKKQKAKPAKAIKPVKKEREKEKTTSEKPKKLLFKKKEANAKPVEKKTAPLKKEKAPKKKSTLKPVKEKAVKTKVSETKQKDSKAKPAPALQKENKVRLYFQKKKEVRQADKILFVKSISRFRTQ